jgi:DNA-binding response OmpR family regulator
MYVCRILSIGYDPILMPVRSLLLREAGYEVVEADSFGEALKKIKAGGFDLVLICHTVAQDEQHSLIEAMRLSWPTVPVLCLTTTPEYSDLMSHGSTACSIAPQFLTDVSNAVRNPPGKRAS